MVPRQKREPGHADPDGVEINITPHPARTGWSTLRVSYPRTPEAEGRISKALDFLMGEEPVEARRGVGRSEAMRVEVAQLATTVRALNARAEALLGQLEGQAYGGQAAGQPDDVYGSLD